MRVLAGVQQAASGHPQARRADGAFADLHGLADAVALGVSYVSGDRKREGIFANLSIFENMLMPLYQLKARGGKIAAIDWKALEGSFNWEVENLLIKMGSRNDRITTLSGGNQQKVLIGRGFATNPEIMILNDPARGVDVGAKAELYKHLSAFAAQGRAIVYMSSELEEFIGFCSRVLVFRNGGVFDVYGASELDSAAILASMFGQAHNGDRSQSARNLADANGANVDGNGVGRIKIREFVEPFIRRFDEATQAVRVAQAPPAIKIVEFEDGEPVVSKGGDGDVRHRLDPQRAPRL